MSIKKVIKRKKARAKKFGSTETNKSSSKRSVANSSNKKTKRSKSRVQKPIFLLPTPTPSGTLEEIRKEVAKRYLQNSSMFMLAGMIGEFVRAIVDNPKSCPNCSEPLSDGRYQIKCKCGYCRIGSTREYKGNAIVAGMVGAAVGLIGASMLSDMNNQNKEEIKKFSESNKSDKDDTNSNKSSNIISMVSPFKFYSDDYLSGDKKDDAIVIDLPVTNKPNDPDSN